MKEIREHWRKWVYWFVLGVAIIVVYKLLDNFSDIMQAFNKFFRILSPFLAGILIAYLLFIPCRKVERAFEQSKSKFVKKRARLFGITTVYIIAALLIIILINVILPVVVSSVVDLINNIQGYYETTIDRYNNLPEDSIFKGEGVQDIVAGIQNADIKQYFKLDKILDYLKGAINVVSSVFDIFVTVIVSIYILSQRSDILRFLKNLGEALFSKKTYRSVGKYFNSINEIFFKFVASQFLDAIIVGILTSIAMWLMGIKYAPLLGFMIGLFNMIPYIGAIIAVGLACIITLITGGISQAIWMLIVVIILQQIDANIINPKIIGNSLEISPLLVIFAVTFGGAYFGILGMFLAVPVIAVVKVIVEDYIEYRKLIESND